MNTHDLHWKNSQIQIGFTDKVFLWFFYQTRHTVWRQKSVFYFRQSSSATYQILENTL